MSPALGSTISIPEIQPAVEPQKLPRGNDPSIILDLPTQSEYDHAWRINAPEWRGMLTTSQYFSREAYLLTAPLTRKGQCHAWILTSPTLPKNSDGSRPILSGCETFLKNAYVARSGKVEKILAHGIGSVFCRHEYRGKGYAGRMISELGKKLETHQQPEGKSGTFSVLYSDIGPKFYAKYGWKAFQSTHIILPPLDPSEYRKLQNDWPAVEDLVSEDLPKIPTTLYLEEKLEKLSKDRPNVPHVAIQPDFAHFGWHQMREEFLCEVSGRPFPKIKGAIHRSTGIALIWCRVYAEDPSEWHLDILHVAIPPSLAGSSKTVEALSALLLRAQSEAHAWSMQAGVELWDPSEEVLQAAQRLRSEEDGEIEIISRDDKHICCLKWNGPEDEVVWVAKEKYPWC